MQIKTNVVEMVELCDKLKVPCEFYDEAHDRPFMLIEGQAVQEMVDFAKSTKGKMLFSLI